MKTQKIAKQVKVIARIEFKADSRKVVYRCQSSNGVDVYSTFLFDGKACSCECKATKPCYHMVQCQAKEQARRDERETARINRELAFA
jgi:hypothetical protein